MEEPIQVVDYNANWSIQYEQEKIQILNALGNAVIDIQHTGSTSVPRLAAKPIIDIAVGLRQIPPSNVQIFALEQLGYFYQGEAGVPGRHFFHKGKPRTHHLHFVALGGEIWDKQTLFRDFLKAHPDKAKQYEALKRELAVKYRLDEERYTSSKAPLIGQLLIQARVWRQGL